MMKNAKGCLGLTILLLGIGTSVILFFRHLKYKAIDEARNAQVVASLSDDYWLIPDPNALNGAEWEGQYVQIEGYVCDYNELSYGEYYLELTSAIQTDSSVLIARHLDALDLQHGAVWTACDSSMWRTQRMYNFQEARFKLFINVEVIDFQDHIDMNRLIFNQPCRHFVSKQKRYEHHLHNYCYNFVGVKARLESVRAYGDSLYISLDRGIVTKLEEVNWQFN